MKKKKKQIHEEEEEEFATNPTKTQTHFSKIHEEKPQQPNPFLKNPNPKIRKNTPKSKHNPTDVLISTLERFGFDFNPIDEGLQNANYLRAVRMNKFGFQVRQPFGFS